MATFHQLTAPALRYFLEVARCGSISEASSHLNVATSAISRQISGLENHLGTPLFERRPRGMILSAAGELLSAYARKVLLETDRIVGEINALEGLQKGTVSIATTEGFAMEFLPYVIAEYRKQFSGIHFKLDVYSPHEVANTIRNGDADIGIAFSLTPTPELRVVHTQPAPILAIVHPKHPLAEKKRITLAQLVAYPLALPYPDTTLRQLFDICISQQQLSYEAALVSTYMSALNQFTINGSGVSLSGEISVRRLISNSVVKAIPISDKMMGIRNTEVQVLAGRTLPKAVQSFLDYLTVQLQPNL
ncbi:LysR family transcriptional regulator [Vibrio spartinae]|uniref:Cyn operon transcriptional activator n=1 Tax=Vibrio spartinae TaxID=1918945 RepID=A0A1N6M6T5_9VIBR|nr:LysR family transcriptional regulator [Vibrio spartinae]QMV13876.1 Cyn operon transcriptional activator [Vibrio spartinae]SIO95139.1 HTH-type transcriptional regulator CynR [Vibrio spartinae]